MLMLVFIDEPSTTVDDSTSLLAGVRSETSAGVGPESSEGVVDEDVVETVFTAMVLDICVISRLCGG